MENKAKCYWITGLSGAGKTTLAKKIKSKINNSILLDGDIIREILNISYGYDIDSRLKLAYVYAKMAKMMVENNINVICSTISLFHEVQYWNRKNIPGYVEVFLDVDMHELERRDPKHIYSKSKSGNLKNVVGVDIAAEFPLNPDYRIRNNQDCINFLEKI